MSVTADPISEVLDKLPGHRKAGNGWSAKCPAHDDRNASLSITTGDGGRVLLKCFAGCSAESICSAVGLKLSDLFYKNLNGNGHAEHAKPKHKPVIDAVYQYINPDTGEVLYEKIRYRPKGFAQRRKVEGGWSYSLGDVQRVLYRLPELNEADFTEMVYFTEGEKAAEAVRGIGFVATCSGDGASAGWRDTYTEHLRGRHVAILPDNDEVGREHGKKVATAIIEAAASVRIVELPGLPDKGDVYDFLAAGHTADELSAIVEATPLYKPGPITSFQTVRDLMRQYPELRPPVIRGLLRRGETMNIISSPKMGKSWLVLGLAICVASGLKWLGTFETVQGDVLIIDNELHGETMASRIPRVAAAMGMSVDVFCDRIFVENVRGKLRSIFEMEAYFNAIEPGRFKIIILDAFYRFQPPGADENDNATMANIYNFLDRVADRLGCCFILIHHTTKGLQSAKGVTDVGSGAGSQSRATDTHGILRAHEEDGVVVFDAAVRSWAPIEPFCLRWTFPLFNPAPELDPTQLRQDNRRKRKEEKPEEKPEDVIPEVKWDTAAFVSRFITAAAKTESTILIEAGQADLSERKAKRFLDAAMDANLIHRWTFSDRKKPHRFSTVEQTLLDTGNEVKK